MAEADGATRTFRLTPEEISAADTWIEEVAARWGVAERASFGARLIVAEIAANVMEHGSGSIRPREVEIALRPRGDGLDVEIVDSGEPFDPTTAPERPLPTSIETAEIGGLGLRLVRAYGADISYRRDGAHNRLRLHVPAASR
jgi:serine/threonine-protein kinase RsbW